MTLHDAIIIGVIVVAVAICVLSLRHQARKERRVRDAVRLGAEIMRRDAALRNAKN